MKYKVKFARHIMTKVIADIEDDISKYSDHILLPKIKYCSLDVWIDMIDILSTNPFDSYKHESYYIYQAVYLRYNLVYKVVGTEVHIVDYFN